MAELFMTLETPLTDNARKLREDQKALINDLIGAHPLDAAELGQALEIVEDEIAHAKANGEFSYTEIDMLKLQD